VGGFPMDILIIGNGFDLAHGLETGYKDFLSYCYNENSYAYEQNLSKGEYENPISKSICEPLRGNWWYKYFLEEYLPQNNLGERWIDFETEIYEFIANLNWELGVIPYSCEDLEPTDFLNKVKILDKKIVEISTDILQNYNKIKSEIIKNKEYTFKGNRYVCRFWDSKKFIDILYIKLLEFSRAFKFYCSEVIDKKEVKPIYDFKKISNSGIDYLVSFNYTNTFNRLYPYIAKNSKLACVHGNCNDEYRDIIFGTQSFDRQGIDEDLPIELNIFEKYTQRHKFNTIGMYQYMLNDMYEQCTPHTRKYNKISIIGHSLDKTDHGLLRAIFENSGQCAINVYYHDFESQENYIRLMREIIGEDEVTRRVRFIDSLQITTQEEIDRNASEFEQKFKPILSPA
jgi:hypothetical protein